MRPGEENYTHKKDTRLLGKKWATVRRGVRLHVAQWTRPMVKRNICAVNDGLQDALSKTCE